MRHLAAAFALLTLLPPAIVWAQQPSQSLPEGLQPATIPQRYEPPSPSASPESLEARGDELRRQKAYADANDYYRTALARTRDKATRASLNNKIGIAELQLQRFHDAEKSFGRALKIQKDLVEARNNLGVSFYLEKKYTRAIKEYREAVRMQDDNASFHSNLATALFAHKELDAAMNEYVHAFQLDPTVFDRSTQSGISAKLSKPENQAQYAYMLARMYAKMGDLDRSIVYLKKALEDGFKDVNNVYKDQDFATLRADPRFTKLMADRPPAIPE